MTDVDRLNSLAQDGDRPVSGVDKRDPATVADGPFLRVVDGQHDWDRHVDDGTVSEAETVKMKRLEELGFPHEAGQGARPPFAEHVHPLQVDPRQPDLRAPHRLPAECVPCRTLRSDQVDQPPAVRLDQAA